MNAEKPDLAEQQARSRRTTDLIWHLGTYLIIIGFFLLMDARLGQPGIQWAGWIAAAWGFALAFHLLDWVVAQVASRKG